jgi:hypothetical protein
MKVLDKRGEMNVLLIPLILLVLLLIGAAVFGVWAYNGRQDYKNNVDQKVAIATQAAQKDTQAKDAKQYAEVAKQPLKTYVGPSAYGSVHISYPKTWSGVADTSDDGTPLDAYFDPDIVPGLNDPSAIFALRVQVVSSSYDDVLSGFSGQVESKQVTAAPYALPSVPGIVGTRLDGQITDSKQGSMVVLPLRDKTLQIWTESSQYLNDFNTNILPHISFSP